MPDHARPITGAPGRDAGTTIIAAPRRRAGAAGVHRGDVDRVGDAVAQPAHAVRIVADVDRRDERW